MEGKRKVRKERTQWVRRNVRKEGKMKTGSWVCSWKGVQQYPPAACEGLSVTASDKLALYYQNCIQPTAAALQQFGYCY